MHLTPTHINYYMLCHRKLWLFHQGIQMEQTSDTVYEGKLIGEYAYPQRSEKYTELALTALWEGITLSAKIDFFDTKEKVVHETKKSDKLEKAHIAQVKFYLYILEKNGVEAPSGILEYPKLKQKLTIPALSEEDKTEIETWIKETYHILTQEQCPERIKKSYCKTCAYFDFCYIDG